MCGEGLGGSELQVTITHTGDDQPELSVVGLDRDIMVDVRIRVSFGHLDHEWHVPEVDVLAGQTTPVPIDVPTAAFLHPLADTYVSTVLVRVHAVDEHGRGLQEVATPNLYLVWPDGPDEAPVVWSKADLATHAPYGILDPDGSIGARIAAELPGVPVRLMPPIGDLDGTDDNDLLNHVGETNCEGIPSPGLASYVTARDWLDDLIAASDPAGCGGSSMYVGSQLDWLRYGWDMITDESVDILYFVDLYDMASPWSWDPNDFDPFDPNYALSDLPINRWEWAADNHPALLGDEHDAQKDNGQDH